jgi:hypothetical protein
MNAEATSVRAAKRLGAAVPGPWSAPRSDADAAIRAATRLLLVPFRLLATPLGRRLAAAAVLSVVLVAMVSSLYDHADGAASPSARALRAAPASAARPASAVRASGQAAQASSVGAAAPARAIQAVVAARPEDAARDWYARQRRIPTDRVTALQRQRVSSTVTRVLVMAEVSPSEIPTALVTVRRDGSRWKVS